MIQTQKSILTALVALTLTSSLQSCGGSDTSNAPIKPVSPIKKAELPTKMSFKDGLITMDTKISEQAWRQKAQVLNLLATKDPTIFVAKVELQRSMKYYLVDTSKNTLNKTDEIAVSTKAQALGYPNPNYKAEFIDDKNRLIVFDGNNKSLYISPISNDANAKITAFNLSKVLNITSSAKPKLVYSKANNTVYFADLKSNAARLYSVDLSSSKPKLTNHNALLTKIGATEINDIAWAGDKEKGYLFITHKVSKDNKVLTVLDSNKLSTPDTAKVSRFFESISEKTGKLFVSPNQKMVLAVIQDPKTNKSQIRVVNTGIHVEQHGEHSHRHDDGISLMAAKWDANANYFSPKQMYHSNQYIAALLQAKAYKSEKPTQFSLLNDELIKQLGDGSLSQPPAKTLPDITDGRVLVVSDRYVLASIKGEEDTDYSKKPTKVQLFEVAKKGGVLSLDAKQVFTNECPNISRIAQSESYSLFACENKILSIRNQKISK